MSKSYEKRVEAGYEGLITGIIKQAVLDYYSGLRALAKNPHNFTAQNRVYDSRKFMLSNWFASMTEVDGKWLAQTIEKDVAEEIKRKKCDKLAQTVTN